jgi:MoxR-like ATPase
MKTSVGYPDADATVRILGDAKVRDRARRLQPVVTAGVIGDMAALADEVYVDPALLSYIALIAEASRRHPSLKLGLSVRGCLAYVRCAKTWAASQGRTYVVPDDIKMLAVPVLSHRLLLDAEAQFSGTTVLQVIDQILGDVPPPVQGNGQAPTAAGRPATRPDPEQQLWPDPGEDEAAAKTLHRTPNPASLDPSRIDPHTPNPRTD